MWPSRDVFCSIADLTAERAVCSPQQPWASAHGLRVAMAGALLMRIHPPWCVARLSHVLVDSRSRSVLVVLTKLMRVQATKLICVQACVLTVAQLWHGPRQQLRVSSHHACDHVIHRWRSWPPCRKHNCGAILPRCDVCCSITRSRNFQWHWTTA